MGPTDVVSQACHACGQEPSSEKLIAVTVCACCCIFTQPNSPSASCGSSPMFQTAKACFDSCLVCNRTCTVAGISPILLWCVTSLLHLLSNPLHCIALLVWQKPRMLLLTVFQECQAVGGFEFTLKTAAHNGNSAFVSSSAALQIVSCQRSKLDETFHTADNLFAARLTLQATVT